MLLRLLPGGTVRPEVKRDMAPMPQLSYWLFPLLAGVYVAAPALRTALLPGLLSACVAGSLNSHLVGNDLATVGHAAAAAALLAVANAPAWRRRRPGWLERTAAVGAWALAALLVIAAIPLRVWPYRLHKGDMLWLFWVFLPAGAVV